MKTLLVGPLLALAALTVAPRLAAQATPEFGAFAGVGLPVGDFGDAADVGVRIGGLVQVKPATLPVALRGEVGFQRFGATVGSSYNILDVTGNAVYSFPGATDAPTSFYGIGGVGAYTVNRGGGTRLGLNAGAGVAFDLGGFKAFAEARFHTVFAENTNTTIIPLTFGIRF